MVGHGNTDEKANTNMHIELFQLNWQCSRTIHIKRIGTASTYVT